MINAMKRLHGLGIGTLLCAVFLMLCSLTGTAQTVTGNIGGTVTDATGAVVPNATVKATQAATGAESVATTNDAGAYNLRFLPIGNYKVEISAAGFGTEAFGPFALEIGQDAKVDAKLKVGSATANIEVTANFVPMQNTENNTIATILDSNVIENVALNGRNFSTLTLFLPGAVSTQPAGMSGANGTERNTGSNGQTSVNGNRNQTNNYYLDGIEINETMNNLIGYNPSPDALDEVQVISANAPAEYGNVNGGDVIAMTKTGTNKWHGSAFGFLENWKLDANTWGNKHQGAKITHYTQPMWGGTLGGPIFKNRLFFFMDYEAARKPSAGQGTANVATDEMREGNFRSLYSTYGATAGQLYNNANNAATGSTPFNQNQITVLNPVATYLFAHPEIYPHANVTATGSDPIVNNYLGTKKSFQRNDQGDIRIDGKLSDMDTFYVRWLQGEASDGTLKAVLPITFPSVSSYPDKGIAINETHAFSSALVNEFRAGYTRIRWIQGFPADSTGVFGLKGDSLLGINATQPYPGFASIEYNACGNGSTCSGYNNPTNIGNRAGSSLLTDNTFQYSDNLTWLHGHNNFKMGVNFTRYQQNSYYPGGDGADGYFQYYPTYTMNPATSAPGYALADFELDAAGAMGQGGLDQNGKVSGGTGQRQWREGYFFQDDWKFRPNLTFNLGARYEFDQPIFEVNNKQANINFDTKTIEYAGKSGASRALYDATYSNFMPRVGFNYQPNGKTVVRGGFGITTYLEGTGQNLRLTYNPPYWNEVDGTSVSPTSTTSGIFFKAENGFASGSSPSLAGSTYRAWHNVKPSVINEWSLATEYALAAKTNLTLAYVGESGQHLIQAVAGNQLTTPCTVNGTSSVPSSDACAAVDPAPFKALVGQNGSVVITASEGMMNYNALQASLRQRAVRGLEYTINYTYGHAMTTSTGFYGVPDINGSSAYAQNAYDNHSEYGPAGQDVRHNLNGTAVYALPLGRGKQYGANLNRTLDEAVGGWKVAMTAVVYSGFPVTIYGDDNSLTGAHAARANQYRKIKVTDRSIDHWFGIGPSVTSCTDHGVDNGVCAYGNTAYGTFGSARPGTERAPGYQQYDFSAYKDFSLFKEHKLTFRADFFNAFNITSYGNPNSYYNSGSTFGQITDVRSPARQIQFAGKYTF